MRVGCGQGEGSAPSSGQEDALRQKLEQQEEELATLASVRAQNRVLLKQISAMAAKSKRVAQPPPEPKAEVAQQDDKKEERKINREGVDFALSSLVVVEPVVVLVHGDVDEEEVERCVRQLLQAAEFVEKKVVDLSVALPRLDKLDVSFVVRPCSYLSLIWDCVFAQREAYHHVIAQAVRRLQDASDAWEHLCQEPHLCVGLFAAFVLG